MHKRILTIVVFLSFSGFFLKAQSTKDGYFHIASTSIVPADVINPLKSKIKGEIEQRNNRNISERLKPAIDSAIASDLFLQNILLSGEVLYGDSIGNYINKVADELFKSDPVLRKSFHFFVIRSGDATGYRLNGNCFFITTAMVSQLENEGQLAFILAHGIGHTLKNHPERMNLKFPEATNVSDHISYADCLSASRTEHTKKEELEADLAALELMRNSGYSFQAIDDAFDFYQYNNLPFDDVPFDRSFFESSNFKLRDTLILKSVTPIHVFNDKDRMSDYDYELHERRGKLNTLAGNDNTGRKKVIVSKAEFLRIREQARFSVCSDYLLQHDYVNAIYSSYLLLKKHPSDVYLKSVVAKALYALTIESDGHPGNSSGATNSNAANYHTAISIGGATEEPTPGIEGNSESLFYLFDNIEPVELNAMAISYTWNVYQQTKNGIFKPVLDSLFTELFLYNRMRDEDFSRLSRGDLKQLDSINTYNKQLKKETVDDDDEPSKYETIRSGQLKQEITSEAPGFKFVFTTFFKNEEFTGIFDRNLKAIRGRKPGNGVVADLSVKKIKIPGVVLVDPFYHNYTQKKNELKADPEKDSVRSVKYKELLIQAMQAYRIGYKIIDNKDPLKTDVAGYNDLMLIHYWIVQREKDGVDENVALSAENIEQLVTKYGTPYFVFAGARAIRSATGDKTIQVFKMYNIITGELVQYDIKNQNIVSGDDELSLAITNCARELAKNIDRDK